MLAATKGTVSWKSIGEQRTTLTRAVELDTGLDFVELEEDERVGLITVSVVVSEGLQSLSLLALGHEPSGGFGGEQDEEELEDGGETLEDGGDTPSPVVLDELGTEGGPRGAVRRVSKADATKDCKTRLHNVTGIPEGVVEGGQLRTVGRVGQLGDQHGGGVGSERQTETDEETVRAR